MANMRAIRTRIRSISNTQQITKAMKMVAASKLRRVQGNMQCMKRLAAGSQEVLDRLLESDTELNNPFITPRENIRKVCYVMFVGNRGLCGMYNNAVLHFMEDIMDREERDMEIIVCGKWGKEIFKRFSMPVVKIFDEMSDTPSEAEARGLMNFLIESYLSEEYDEIHLVYQSYVSALSQKPTDKRILPVEADVQKEQRADSYVDYFFEPDPKAVLDKVLRMYVVNKIYSVLLESKCCEHSARVTAMSSATDNTEKLISKLRLSYNRARQAAITTEISEIVGGAAALKNKR